MFPVLPCFVVPPVNLNGGIIPTKICLSVSKTFCVNSNTVWRSFTVVFGAGCAEKYLSVDTFYTSLYLHDYVALLYRDSISHPHIILSDRCLIIYFTACIDGN